MQEEQKLEIIKAAQDYMKAKNLRLDDLQEMSKVNKSYLSNMLRCEFDVVGRNNRMTPIADKWFKQLANAVGFKITKVYIETVATVQFVNIINALEEAKDPNGNTSLKTIIAESGSGKSFTVNKFRSNHPRHTYIVTVSSLTTLPDIINELCEKIGVEQTGTKSSRLRRIANKLIDIKHSGEQPVIIIDEAENLANPALKMMKALYDAVKGYAVIVQMGTSQLLTKMHKLCAKNKEGMPQYYRRMKAGIVQIPRIDRKYNEFLDAHVEDRGLRRLLCEICDNYGELVDYLEPALREADNKGVPLTEDLFRIIYNMPNNHKRAS